jgi:hypothetical protein
MPVSFAFDGEGLTLVAHIPLQSTMGSTYTRYDFVPKPMFHDGIIYDIEARHETLAIHNETGSAIMLTDNDRSSCWEFDDSLYCGGNNVVYNNRTDTVCLLAVWSGDWNGLLRV